MSTPDTTLTALLRNAFEQALAAVIAETTAPLQVRLDELAVRLLRLENAEPADVTDPAAFASTAFHEAVMEVISNNAEDVVDSIKEELTEARGESIADAVENAIRNGSFDVSFSRY